MLSISIKFVERACCLFALAAFAVACSPGFKLDEAKMEARGYKGGSGVLSISWNANLEKAVNRTGGGYRVYYTQINHIAGTTPYVDVPYVSGATAPTSVKITELVSGKYYVRVVGYSTANTGSPASTPAVVVIP